MTPNTPLTGYRVLLPLPHIQAGVACTIDADQRQSPPWSCGAVSAVSRLIGINALGPGAIVVGPPIPHDNGPHGVRSMSIMSGSPDASVMPVTLAASLPAMWKAMMLDLPMALAAQGLRFAGHR